MKDSKHIQWTKLKPTNIKKDITKDINKLNKKNRKSTLILGIWAITKIIIWIIIFLGLLNISNTYPQIETKITIFIIFLTILHTIQKNIYEKLDEKIINKAKEMTQQ